jgi:hypothetical protein
MADTKQKDFSSKMIDAMPRWAMAVIGILLSLMLVLKIGGLDVAVQRIAGALATSIETRIDVALETKVTKRFDSIDAELKDHKERIVAIENENKKFHKSVIRD